MPSLNYLYVEDDRLSRDVMDMIMADMLGITSCVIFEDSTDFMRRLRELDPSPDVIFLDIHMEPITGFEMLELIRADAEFSGRRVFALTASVMNEEVNQLREAGFDGVMGKPLDADLFPELIQQLEAGQNVWQIT